MSINLVKILVLSLAILTAFSLLKSNLKNHNFYRWSCILILLPATIAIIILIKISTTQNGIISTLDTSLLKSLLFLDFGLHIELLDIITISCLIISLQSFLFIAEKSIFSENLLVTISTTLFLVLMQIFSNLFVISIIFSIGSIFITFERILIGGDNIPAKDLTRDFIWQRISDFLTITGLITLIYNTENIHANKIITNYLETTTSSGMLLFISTVIRIISIKPSRNDSITSSSVFHISNTQYKFYISLGSIILLTKMRAIIFNDLHVNIFFQITAGTLTLVSIISLIMEFKKSNKDSYLIFFAAASSLFFISITGLKYFYILALITIFILPIQLVISRNISIKPTARKKLDPIDLVLSANFTSRKIVLFLSRISENFIHPFYASFLLYRLPQLLVSALQIPLRFFHTGSIQRSLLFMVLMAASYYSIWGL